MKELLGEEIAKRLKNGDTIGVGTGSTVDIVLTAIGKKVSSEKLNISCVPTSHESAWRCEEMGLKVIYPGFLGEIAWGFDGADEVDEKLRLIKGRGGAMFGEKIMAAKCKEYIVVVDESKLVKNLGEKFPVPVEVYPSALSVALSGLKKLGAMEVNVRQAMGKFGAVITESGNLILDARFDNISDSLESEIKSIVGVIESGLFLRYATEALIAGKNGVRRLIRDSA